MASWSKADLADRVLENLGVKPASQSANANDALRVSEAIDSAHQRLSRYGWAPFAVGAVPEWAQTPMRDYVSADVASMFGIGGEALQRILVGKQAAEREFARWTQIPKNNGVYTETKFY